MATLLRLYPSLPGYHERRREKHGDLYFFVRTLGISGALIEARSLATGVICTLDRQYVEVADDGTELSG